jgi:hypothetical protein
MSQALHAALVAIDDLVTPRALVLPLAAGSAAAERAGLEAASR